MSHSVYDLASYYHLQREGITEKIVTKYGLDADEILPEGEQNE